MTKKISQLTTEKDGLLANMEVCVSSLRELKAASDAAHANAEKVLQEKNALQEVLDEKDTAIVSLNAKIAELNRKIQASPNRNVKEEAMKLARL